MPSERIERQEQRIISDREAIEFLQRCIYEAKIYIERAQETGDWSLVETAYDCLKGKL